VNRRQRAGPVEDRELAGIAPIGLDPIARAARDEGRGNDVARYLSRGERALQLETTGPAS
jgi:hypothetical protein